jgi:hypothetical protein
MTGWGTVDQGLRVVAQEPRISTRQQGEAKADARKQARGNRSKKGTRSEESAKKAERAGDGDSGSVVESRPSHATGSISESLDAALEPNRQLNQPAISSWATGNVARKTGCNYATEKTRDKRKKKRSGIASDLARKATSRTASSLITPRERPRKGEGRREMKQRNGASRRGDEATWTDSGGRHAALIAKRLGGHARCSAVDPRPTRLADAPTLAPRAAPAPRGGPPSPSSCPASLARCCRGQALLENVLMRH